METTLAIELTADGAAFAGGLVGGALVAVLAFSCIWGILLLIACWKIFTKAGEKGWKVLIPIYNLYIFFKIVKMQKWFWALLATSVLVGIVMAVLGVDMASLEGGNYAGVPVGALILYIADLVFAFIVSVISYARLSKVFGHGIGFTIGLIFLSGIFALILGFGKSKYNKEVAKSWK